MIANNTSSFILPILGLPVGILLTNGFQSAYLGDETTNPGVWGEYLYLTFDKHELTQELIEELKDHGLLNKTYQSILDDSIQVYRFDIDEEDSESIVQPFIKGKYSEINREYVKENFYTFVHSESQGKIAHKPIMNYLILTKDDKLREYWEDRLGCELPENAEIWSLPEKVDEIYGYVLDLEN